MPLLFFSLLIFMLSTFNDYIFSHCFLYIHCFHWFLLMIFFSLFLLSFSFMPFHFSYADAFLSLFSLMLSRFRWFFFADIDFLLISLHIRPRALLRYAACLLMPIFFFAAIAPLDTRFSPLSLIFSFLSFIFACAIDFHIFHTSDATCCCHIIIFDDIFRCFSLLMLRHYFITFIAMPLFQQ